MAGPLNAPPRVYVRLECPECGRAMKIREGRYGRFYSCEGFPACRGTVSALPSGTPLAEPADRRTKDARARAHDALAALWESGAMSRQDAYDLAARLLGLPPEECRLGSFDLTRCEELVARLREAGYLAGGGGA